MHPPQRPMNMPERMVARFLVTKAGAWFGWYILPAIDRPLLYVTRGRISMSPGQPILLLISRGARSGKLRSTPLLYLPDGERLIVVASAGGRPYNPGWYYNLKANREATVYVRGRAGRFIAHEASGDERSELWRRAKQYNLGFAVYEQRTQRHIPIMVLTPVQAWQDRPAR